jgi:hypothetical protein
MGIEVKMDMREIREYLNREAQRHLQRTITLLQYVGETVVNDIRTSHISNWTDQTGNLRSSIGYIITVDGRPIGMSDFPKVIGPITSGSEADGTQMGKDYARQLASLYPEGIALIVVAGMEYASYVEKRDNKTVLAQGEVEARRLVEQMIRELNSKTQ